MLYITDFGAKGDGITLNTAAFRQAVEAARDTGETVAVPAGTFLTGTISLDGVSLYLEAGAVIKASPRLEDYPDQDFVHNEMGRLKALIVNLRHDHVSITGSGTIDLNGRAFYDHSRHAVPDQTKIPLTDEQVKECTWFIGQRPAQCIFFHESRDILISGITILDAPCWTVSISCCEKVRITGLCIDTDLNTPNDDGIHISACRDVLISDCHISSGDDCIALSCITDWERPCENVAITNCVLRSCSKAIVIGYIYSVVRNVLITNCIIRESNRGLCFMCHTECGMIENVRVSSMLIDTRVRAGNWWGNGEPLLMMALPHDMHLPSEQKPHRSEPCAIRNIRLTGITCTGENAMGIIGLDGNIRDIYLSDIDYMRKPANNLPIKGNTFDLSPSGMAAEAPADCALRIQGTKEVYWERVNTGGLLILQDENP